jgi:hypothetical protein
MHKLTVATALILGSLSVNVFASDVTELPRATMSELAQEPVPFVSAHVAREHERPEMHRFASPFALNVPAAPEAASTIVPPHIALTFRDTYDPPRAYPADAAGAVGPHHILGVTNVWITVHDRSGNSLSSVFQEQFWSEPTGAIFDPRAYYDASADRWIVTALIDFNLENAFFLVAVSASGDPLGTWRRFRIPTSAGNNQSYDLDFARLATTTNSIVISARYFVSDNFIGMTAILLPKGDAYSASNPVNANRVTINDPVDEFTPIESDDAVVRFASIALIGSSLQVWEASGSGLALKATWTPVFGATGNQFVWGEQLGTSTAVDISQTDFTSALMRGGTLWLMQEYFGAALLWRQSGSAAPTITAISDPQGKVAYAFPSMAITRDNAILIAYAMFNSNAYISSGYTYVDPFGNVSASTTIRNGEGTYRHDRWGDFSTTVVDPVDHTSFWTVQIYPMQHPTVPTQYVWATCWSHITNAGSRVRAVRH